MNAKILKTRVNGLSFVIPELGAWQLNLKWSLVSLRPLCGGYPDVILRHFSGLLIAIGGCLPPCGALAQSALDRADPSIAERQTPQAEAPDTVKNVSIAVEQATSEDAAAGPTIMVGAIRIDGASAIPVAQFSGVIDKYIGQELDAAGLKRLARSVADVARAQGFAFATAWIEPQAASVGVIRVRIDEGRIEAIAVDGVRNYAAEQVLQQLVTGAPVPVALAERQLLLVADIPGVQLLSSRYERVDGRGVLRVHLGEDRIVSRVYADNRGTSVVGPVRARLSFDIRGLIADGDELSLQTVITPGSRELRYASAGYSVKLSSAGTSAYFSASYGATRPGGSFAGLGLRGESVDALMGLSRPVIRSRAISLWAFGEARYAKSTQFLNGLMLREDRTSTVSIGLRGNARVIGGHAFGFAAITQGFSILDATQAGDPASSRADGGDDFTKIAGYVDWVRPLFGPLSLRATLSGQWASQPLLAADEFGLGGAALGRGYDYYERSGDRGAAGLAEIRYNLPIAAPNLIRSAQIYSFADAGVTDNLGVADDAAALYSAGGGFRFGLFKNADASIEAAFPLNADRFDSGNRHPRISSSVSFAF